MPKQTKKAVETKISSVETEPIAAATVEGKEVLVFRAKERLDKETFATAAEMLRKEQEETGVTIVLVPFSVDGLEE